MSTTVPLSASGQVTLSGAGGGQVQLGPALPGTSWTPASVAVLVTPVSSSTVSEFFLYGPNGQFLGGTYTGDNNSCGISGIILYPGQVLTGVWQSGNPGAIAAMTVTGTMDIPG